MYDKATALVEQYNLDLAACEQEVNRNTLQVCGLQGIFNNGILSPVVECYTNISFRIFINSNSKDDVIYIIYC